MIYFEKIMIKYHLMCLEQNFEFFIFMSFFFTEWYYMSLHKLSYCK